MIYNLLPLTTVCMGLIHGNNGVHCSCVHWVVTGNVVYEAVVSALQAVPLFSKASVVLGLE